MHWGKTNRGSRLGWAHHSGLENRESLGVIGDLREWEQRVHMSLAGGHRVEALGQGELGTHKKRVHLWLGQSKGWAAGKAGRAGNMYLGTVAFTLEVMEATWGAHKDGI